MLGVDSAHTLHRLDVCRSLLILRHSCQHRQKNQMLLSALPPRPAAKPHTMTSPPGKSAPTQLVFARCLTPWDQWHLGMLQPCLCPKAIVGDNNRGVSAIFSASSAYCVSLCLLFQPGICSKAQQTLEAQCRADRPLILSCRRAHFSTC